MFSFISSDRHVSRCFSVCFAPAGRPPDNWRRQEKKRGRKKRVAKSQTKCSFPSLPSSSLPPSFAFSVFHVTFSKVCVFTQRRSLSGAENHVPLRLNLLVRPQAKTVMCLIFIINSNPRFCSWFKLEVVLIALAVTRSWDRKSAVSPLFGVSCKVCN